jgi:hypothetical protein
MGRHDSESLAGEFWRRPAPSSLAGFCGAEARPVMTSTDERPRANMVWDSEVADLRAALGLLGSSKRDLTMLIICALILDLAPEDRDAVAGSLGPTLMRQHVGR